jgi:hypothetical protein
VDDCRDILLHCSILCSQLGFTANRKKKPCWGSEWQCISVGKKDCYGTELQKMILPKIREGLIDFQNLETQFLLYMKGKTDQYPS